MSWLKKLLPSIRTNSEQKKGVPEGVWAKCESCGSVLYTAELERCLQVCPKCDHHHKFNARKRLQSFLDADSLIEIAAHIAPNDILRFKDSKKYKDRLAAAQKSTHEKDALIVAYGTLNNLPVVTAIFDFDFMGGSMGSVVGEKFVQGVNDAMHRRCPFICFTSSGGARMQEALFSLMQMAKVSAVLKRFSAAQLPYIVVLTNPTMGGVSASLAMLGDVIIAEPNALIGFAGPRVIEQTTRQTLPAGFQRSEFLLEHGAIDMIIDRRNLRAKIYQLLAKLQHKNPATAE